VTESASALELVDVAVSRGDRVLVSGLSLRLAPGQLALVTGPNGSGKTTLLRSVAGLSRPSAGEIRLDGIPVMRLEPEQRGLLAYQGHLDGLKKDLTIEENIRFYRKLSLSSEVVSEVGASLGLSECLTRPVCQLSAGQKRRAALAALKFAGAKLWLLDEPLTNLDPSGRELVGSWLDAHLADGGMAIVATHLADELKRPGTLLVEL
jgi:heme exporter protein A